MVAGRRQARYRDGQQCNIDAFIATLISAVPTRPDRGMIFPAIHRPATDALLSRSGAMLQQMQLRLIPSVTVGADRAGPDGHSRRRATRSPRGRRSERIRQRARPDPPTAQPRHFVSCSRPIRLRAHADSFGVSVTRVRRPLGGQRFGGALLAAGFVARIPFVGAGGGRFGVGGDQLVVGVVQRLAGGRGLPSSPRTTSPSSSFKSRNTVTGASTTSAFDRPCGPADRVSRALTKGV
jgi:hypothetical protein